MLQRTNARVRSGELSLDGIIPILPMADLSLYCRELIKESCSGVWNGRIGWRRDRLRLARGSSIRGEGVALKAYPRDKGFCNLR